MTTPSSSPGVGDVLTHAETGERVKIVSGRGCDLVVTPLDGFASPRQLPYAELPAWGVIPPAETIPLEQRERDGWARLAREDRRNAVLLGIADGTIGPDGEVLPEDVGLTESAFDKFRRMVASLRRPRPLPTPEEVFSSDRD